jgi:hypothetical protein
MTIWYICVDLVHFSGFVIMYQEKSGDPVPAQTFESVSSSGQVLSSRFLYWVYLASPLNADTK